MKINRVLSHSHSLSQKYVVCVGLCVPLRLKLKCSKVAYYDDNVDIFTASWITLDLYTFHAKKKQHGPACLKLRSVKDRSA